jgi:hypothetical protein
MGWLFLMNLKQAREIAEDPKLHEECKLGRREKFIVSFVFDHNFHDFLSTDIQACCVGAAHNCAYFKLSKEIPLYTDRKITAIIIRRNGVICEHE